MARVIHTGQALVDYVLEVPRLPARGGNVYVQTNTRSAGGAVTILLAAARAGAVAVHAGAHGTGPNGDLIRAALAEAGVALSNPPEPDLDSGLCICLDEPDERTFVTTMGAERRVSPASLQTSAPLPGDVVCIDGYTLVMPSTAEPVLVWLAGLDSAVLTVLDPGADFAAQPVDVRRRSIAASAVWTCNLAEAQALVATSGRAAAAPTDMAAACDALAAVLRPGAVIVVRDGAAGCAVRADGVTTVVPGYPQEAIDTNGAGDTHTGAMMARIVAGDDWVSAARFGNAAAAIKVTRFGPATAPTKAEVDTLLATAG